MKFGPVRVEDAVGAIVAHAVHIGDLVLKKGDLVRAESVPALRAAGLREIVVARLEPNDLGENEAARIIAEAAAGSQARVDRAFTGRANLFAQCAGVLKIAEANIHAINAVDEAITLATLPAFRAVVPGEMIGTVKIIPFAVSRSAVERALAIVAEPLIDVAPFKPMRVGVISTMLPGLKPSVVNKTLSHLAERLAPAGARIVADERVPHDTTTLAGTLTMLSQAADLLVVFGASAITDRRDVIPAGLEAAGGEIDHFGMPVDPGNLLLLGHIGVVQVLGAPGCARSPKENGFDWVLNRILAGIPVGGSDIRRLGVGGLLMEIVSRPQPRAGDSQEAKRSIASSSEQRDGTAA